MKAKMIAVLVAAALAQGAVGVYAEETAEMEEVAYSAADQDVTHGPQADQPGQRRMTRPHGAPGRPGMPTPPSGVVPGPKPATPTKPPTTTPTKPQPTTAPGGTTGGTTGGTLDGAALYQQYCFSCHQNSKKGSSASATQSAINSNKGGMGTLKNLTPAQLQAISTAK